MNRKLLAGCLAACVAVFGPALGTSAGAADYPTSPIRIVVPFAPGGNMDITARTVAPGLSEALGQPVVVDNRGGAGGMLGAEVVAKAAPDGYTLLLASTGSLGAAPGLYPKLKFDPVKDFAMVRAISRVPLVLVVSPALPVKNLQDLIALAKAKPGSLRMASTGNGSSNHLTGELFQHMTGTQLTHIPYRGSSQAMTDLIAGQVDLMFDNIPTSLPFITSGKLHAIAMATAARSPLLPQLPTLAESGLPGFEASTTTGLAFPTGTPQAVVQKVDAALARVLAQPQVRKSFQEIGGDVVDVPGPAYTVLMREQTAKWTQVVRDAKVSAE